MVQCVLVWCSVEPGESYVTHTLNVIRRSVIGNVIYVTCIHDSYVTCIHDSYVCRSLGANDGTRWIIWTYAIGHTQVSHRYVWLMSHVYMTCMSHGAVRVPGLGQITWWIVMTKKMRGHLGKKVARKSRNSCRVNSRSCGCIGTVDSGPKCAHSWNQIHTLK